MVGDRWVRAHPPPPLRAWAREGQRGGWRCSAVARLHTQAWGVDLGKVGVGEGSSAHFRPATCITFPASGPQVAQQHPPGSGGHARHTGGRCGGPGPPHIPVPTAVPPTPRPGVCPQSPVLGSGCPKESCLPPPAPTTAAPGVPACPICRAGVGTHKPGHRPTWLSQRLPESSCPAARGLHTRDPLLRS